MNSLLLFSTVLPAAGVTETWIDDFSDMSLVVSFEGVTISDGKVQLGLNLPVRQGLQIGADNSVSPSIVRVGSLYYMFYSICCIGSWILLATSSDANTWTDQGTVVSPGLSGSSDSGGVTYEDVLLIGSTFHMWYSGLGPSGSYAIHHAASSDGKVWSSDGVVISAASEGISGSVYAPSVMWDGTRFTMWFSHFDGTHTWIRLATSSDGVSWTSRGVVLSPVSDGLDDAGPRMPDVLRVGPDFVMWYACVQVWEGKICRARSADGANWTREGVVLAPDPSLSGENVGMGMPEVTPISTGSYRIWYVARGSTTHIYSALSLSGYRPSGTLVSVPISLPANLTWLYATITKTAPDGSSISVTVNDADTALPLEGFQNLKASNMSLAGIDGRIVPRIALKASLQSDGTDTPMLDRWSVTFGTPPPRILSYWDQYLGAILVGALVGGSGLALAAIMYAITRPARPPRGT